jgi:hypothetical protein
VALNVFKPRHEGSGNFGRYVCGSRHLALQLPLLRQDFQQQGSVVVEAGNVPIQSATGSSRDGCVKLSENANYLVRGLGVRLKGDGIGIAFDLKSQPCHLVKLSNASSSVYPNALRPVAPKHPGDEATHVTTVSRLRRSLSVSPCDLPDHRHRRRAHRRPRIDLLLQSLLTPRARGDMLFDSLDFNFGKLSHGEALDQFH